MGQGLKPPRPSRWNRVHAVVAGTHRGDIATVQDAVALTEIGGSASPTLLVAVADGAGSALHGQAGARLAVATALATMRGRVLRAGRSRSVRSALDGAGMARVLAAVQRALYRIAGPDALREHATTLLLVAADDDATACAQVGDGAIVVRDEGAWRAVFWPDQGEYLNTTRFVTEADPGLRTALLGPVPALALLTDGLQTLALDYAARAPHPPFFAGLFAELERFDGPVLAPALADFLASPGVRARTDDDLTLVLALRRPPAC
ncbi:MAG: protein phosphatase 2C domain-containing protein [Myxococcales bacterium]|nr:protein phosphatase 2C domain-containing protein [Myxococcales bacterium]